MAAAQNRPSPIKEITVAVGRDYAPFYFRDQQGRADGWLVDIWRLWSVKTVRKIEFIFDDWEKTIQLVKDGKADMHSGLHKTQEQETFLSFSEPVFAVQDNLAFRTNQNPLTLGLPMTLKDDLFWRADGTSFPVDAKSNPILQDVDAFLEIEETIKAVAKELADSD